VALLGIGVSSTASGSTRLIEPLVDASAAHAGTTSDAKNAKLNVMPMPNEPTARRWAGETGYAGSLLLPAASNPALQHSRGLPGTDDIMTDDNLPNAKHFLDPRLQGFPDRKDSSIFLESYLGSIHSIFAFVHAKLCRSFFDKLYDDGAQDVDSTNQAAHLAILALGWHSCWKHNTQESRSVIGSDLYHRAQHLSFDSLSKPSIPSLACFVALTLYQQATGQFEAAWTTFGICVRQAQALQLHRDTPDWRISESLKEARRSTWLNIITLDTFLSICYGRPPAIDDAQCDAQLPHVKLHDLKEMPQGEKRMPAQQIMTPLDICAAAPSRAQFHLLKAHLCSIARKVLKCFYLDPTSKLDPSYQRIKWDNLQSIMEDLHELGACIPSHLQVVEIDSQPDRTYQQQAACLDLMINHVIILAYRPFSDLSTNGKGTIMPSVAPNVMAARQGSCKDTLYAAACGICSMVAHGRHSILSITIHHVFSAWGIYSTAAEIIAHYAIQTPAGSPEAREMYENLNSLLKQFARLRRSCSSAGQGYAILYGLIAKVRTKIEVESRLSSPETRLPTTDIQTGDELVNSNNACMRNDSLPHTPESFSLCGQPLDLQWVDEFLESGDTFNQQDESVLHQEQLLPDDLDPTFAHVWSSSSEGFADHTTF